MKGWAILAGVVVLTISGAVGADDNRPPKPVAAKRESVPGVWSEGDLGRQAAELSTAYSRLGKVRRLRPRLLEQNGVHPIPLGPKLTSPYTETCLTVTSVASPNLSFLLLFENAEDQPARRAWPIPSAAGVAEVTRCGARKSLLQGLGVKLRSRRGVVEFVLLESEHPPAPVSELIPGRNPGPSLPSPQVGRRPWLAPLKERLASLTRSNRQSGADRVSTSGLTSDPSGRGGALVHLPAGCHRLQLLAEPDRESPPDLDARLFTLTRGTEVASDEEHSGQVSLEHCVGRDERVRIDFSGARPNSEVTLAHSTWSIPSAFPIGWGPLSRARLAEAVWPDGLQQFRSTPVFSSLGVRGTTRLSMDGDPRACYVAVVAPIRGDVSTIALAASMGPRASQSHAQGGRGTSVTFCGKRATRAVIEVQALGSGVAWILGVWRMGEQP